MINPGQVPEIDGAICIRNARLKLKPLIITNLNLDGL